MWNWRGEEGASVRVQVIGHKIQADMEGSGERRELQTKEEIQEGS